MYDANLRRFLSPDNYIQAPYSTQSFNRFGYVWNNPLKYKDPSGEFGIVAGMLIGAAISVAVNGIANSINGQGFFEGWGTAAVIGAVSGAYASMVGGAVSSMSGVMKVAVQGFAHGHFSGMISAYQGGTYTSGFLSGSLGSVMAGGTGLLLRGAKKGWRAAGMVVAGGLSGGVGSAVSGGNFWHGVRNGLISSTLNHVAHSIQSGLSRYFNNKKKAYNYAVKMANEAIFGDWREVSGWILENGDYIVLEAILNGKTYSRNDALETAYVDGKLSVKMFGSWHEIKSHFHLHPPGYNYTNSNPIGASKKDLNLMYKYIKGPVYILQRGMEYQLSPGNQYYNPQFTRGYNLKNLGKW